MEWGRGRRGGEGSWCVDGEGLRLINAEFADLAETGGWGVIRYAVKVLPFPIMPRVLFVFYFIFLKLVVQVPLLQGGGGQCVVQGH